MAAGVPMTVPAANGAPTEQRQLLEQQPPSRELDGLQAVDVTAEQEPQTLDMLTEEGRAGLCLLDLRASSSTTESDPIHGVGGPAAEDIENVVGDDQAMPDAEEIRNAAGQQPRDNCLSTTTPVNVRVTETNYQPESFLKDVRGLLSTGLLEGFRVTYKKNEVEMTGRIKGQGYSCGCSECGYSNIMNACELEQHSDESSNNQNDLIFLDSGISLYRVIQALKFTRLYLLGESIEEQIGLPPNLVQYEKWKASFQVGKNDFDVAASDPCSIQSSQELAAGKTSHIALATTLAYSLKESTSNDSSNLNWSAFKRRSYRLFKRGGTETLTATLSSSPEKGTSGLSTGTSMKNGTEETPRENTASPLCTDDMKHSFAGPVAVMSTSTECGPINLALSLSSPVTIIQEPPLDHSVDSKSTELCQPKTRDNSLHPLLFKEGGLPDHALLTYKLKNGEVLKQGYKRGTDIVCDCCNEEFTPSQFEDHAGLGRRRQPYRSIYTSEGLTLHELALKLQDGLDSYGIGNANFPTIDEPPNLTSSGSGKESSPTTRPIIIPLKRTLQERLVKTESCHLCGDDHTTVGIISANMIVFCNQCERPCHVKCYNNGIQKHKAPLKVLGEYKQFHFLCCEKCRLLRASLQQGLKKLEEIAFFRQIRSSICWQLLSGMNLRSDLQQYMHQAIDIFKDAFAETAAEDNDVIQDMVNAKDVGGEKDFRGLYCAVLTTSTLVVSAAILKVRTEEVAELVLIATRNECRKKGYFALLLNLIEAHLKAWNIRLLTVPVDPEMASIWSEKLGFTILSDEEEKSLLEAHPLVMFENLRLAQKSLA